MAKGSVLLVEDSPILLRLIKGRLEEEGFTVAPASSAEEAERLAQCGRFDLLITDWHLKAARDGFEVLARLRQRFPRLPSVLMSSDANSTLAERAREAGFDLVLNKPLEMPGIVAVVSALMKAHAPEVPYESS